MSLSIDSASVALGHAQDEISATFFNDSHSERQALALGLQLAERFGGAHPFLWTLGDRSITATPGLAQLLGAGSGSSIPLRLLLRAIGPHASLSTRQSLRLALSRKQDFDIECCVPHDKGPRWLRIRGTMLKEGMARGAGLAGAVVDITAQRLAESALAENEWQIRTVLNTIPQKVWATDPEGSAEFFNERWYSFTGRQTGESEGIAWFESLHPADREAAYSAWRHSVKTGQDYSVQYRLRRADGEYHWMLARGMPLRSSSGRIIRWFGTCTDIHELKLVEESRELISQELSHRIKNIFSVVVSLVQLSARGAETPYDLSRDLCGRIEALSHAYHYIQPANVVQTGNGSPATLQGLMQALFEAYGGPEDRRILLSGEDAPIGRTAATALALVLHELATNATKYGALAAAEGHVMVEVIREADEVTISWTEIGGAAIAGIPERAGFGTQMSERAARLQLGASLERKWDPAGLSVRVAIPADNLAR